MCERENVCARENPTSAADEDALKLCFLFLPDFFGMFFWVRKKYTSAADEDALKVVVAVSDRPL